ncbi:hypothetical protein HQQ94_12915 [Shewanella sp. VB17]|uniref:EutP/PduV family microcompartment system protein n=1 Tax=Shewanella sp. VB17 TaxID=2739432 RepID=UPI001566C9BC|nr:EutP/PduV family microcompartment system protein [Shewanella sp. VB17]NRD74121.1 hypothetical protein [Shewanella sp. VB17]
MKRIVIFGNSGSGKSTLAKQLSQNEGLAHLDLDLIAWLTAADGDIPTRMPVSESKQKLVSFIITERVSFPA